MAKWQGVFLDSDSLGSDVDLSPLAAELDDLVYHPQTAPSEVTARIAGYPVVIVNKVPLGAEAFAAAPALRLVAVTATGVNNVDLDAARAHGVRVVNVVRYGRYSVSQHTFALILALATRLQQYTADVRDGAWNRSSTFCLMHHPIMELAGKTLGIVGYGDLGQGVAHLGRAFGMTVRLAARPGQAPGPVDGLQREPLDQLLPEVDVLSLHCVLSDNTRNLIGARELALMQPHALLINTARGGLVDEQALAEALRAGRLGGAGVDVLTEEPPRHGNPLLAPDIPNLIVTPHSAWASLEARQRMVALTAANLQGFREGTLERFVV